MKYVSDNVMQECVNFEMCQHLHDKLDIKHTCGNKHIFLSFY